MVLRTRGLAADPGPQGPLTVGGGASDAGAVTLALPRTDRQFLDRIEADALIYGGDELLAEMRDEASAWAREHDDALRWSAYLAVAWQLVDARRAELVGQLVETPSGKWQTVTPARCGVGHSWEARGAWVASWLPCRGRGHRGHHRWLCLCPGPDGRDCRSEVVFPDFVEGCSVVGIGEG